MAVPSTRQQFKDYCLRKAGAPVLKINMADDQIEDRIDEALSYYYDFHYDGTERTYYKYLVTDADVANRYITLPPNIIGAVRCFDVGVFMGQGSMFSIRYQIALNDLYTLTSQSMVPYFMAMQGLAEIQELLVGHQPIRFNRKTNILYLDTDWPTMVGSGNYLIVECYQVIDPTEFGGVWGDRWLQNYATALIKLQWGEHLSKFKGGTLPGGLQFDGAGILTRAQAEIEKLEAQLESWQAPLDHFLG